jgi:hypothetical protein
MVVTWKTPIHRGNKTHYLNGLVARQEGGEWSLHNFYIFFSFICDAKLNVATLAAMVNLV